MTKSESKYFNTARKMNEALITLLDKKDFAYITIKEICDVAGVSRSAFYLHYENTTDLLHETAQYIIDRHLTYYARDTQSIAVCYDTCRLEDLLFISTEYLQPYLTFIKENQKTFRVAMKEFHSMNFQGFYNKMFCNIFDPILRRFRVPENERPYMMKFYLSGIAAIITEWVETGCADNIETIIKIIAECIMGERDLHTHGS